MNIAAENKEPNSLNQLAEQDLEPQAICDILSQFIVGQHNAKKLVAIALRNRWRRRKVPIHLQEEITPKNILMIGPTGVGKTEIARRLAKIIMAPFVKVEATRYTEVGYVGRNVEGIIRDLMEISYNLVYQQRLKDVAATAKANALDIVLEKLVPEGNFSIQEDEKTSIQNTREKFKNKLVSGELDDKLIEINVVDKPKGMMEILPFSGNENIDQLRDVLGSMMPKNKKNKRVKIKDAINILTEQESEKLLDLDEIKNEAKYRAENLGIVFIDEFDKIAKGSEYGADVSREGVQRDLLPIVEGSVVATKYGQVNTEHILFIAAGAFHISKPSDLIPEIQGRFPVRVELDALTMEDLYLVLKEPKQSLPAQYVELLKVEGVDLQFDDSALRQLAEFAFKLNSEHENIGARRLQALIEKLLEDINFESSKNAGKKITIDGDFVINKLQYIIKKQDLSRYVL